MEIFFSGQLSYDIALEVNEYLSQEMDPVPWESAKSNSIYLEKMFTNSLGYGSLKVMQNIQNPRLRRV